MGSASRANKRGKDRPKKAQVKKSVPSKLSLAPAKITQPRLIENIYSRKRLFSVLDNALKKPVIWITAQGGAGKTTLITSYLKEKKLPCLWYQIDSGDGDIASFFHYMGIAARYAAPRYKESLPHLTPEYLGGLPVFTRNYFRELFSRLLGKSPLPRFPVSPFQVVFDNYQDAPADSHLHEIIQAGLSEIPEGINVIIISRTEPPSAFAGLRANNRMNILGWNELELTTEETSGIVQLKLQKKLSAEIIQELHDKTNGWAAGLVLMLEHQGSADMVQRHGKGFTTQAMFDYFAGEIFHKLDTASQEILLQTSFLPIMTRRFAEQLTGLHQAGEFLSELNRRNYFTIRKPLPEPVYQYHPLFREFLLTQARQQLTDAQLIQTQRRAAEILEGAGQAEDAIILYSQTGDWASMARIILANAQVMITQGRNQAVEQWINRLPQAVVDETPWLVYWLGVCRMPFNQREARSHLEQAYSGFKQAQQPLGMYLAWTGIVETFSYEWDDYTPLDRWVEEIKTLQHAHPLDRYPQAEPRVVSAALHMLSFARSDDPELQYWVRYAEKLRNELRGSPLYMLLSNALYLHYGWIGDLDKLREWSQDLGACVMASDTEPLARLTSCLTLCVGGWICGDLALSRHWVKMAMEYGAQQGIPFLNSFSYGQLNYICQLDNDPEGAALCLAQLQSATRPECRLDVSHYYYHATWLSIERGEFAQARAYIEKSLALNEALSVRYPIALSRIKLAEVLVEFAEFDTALQHLNRALDFAGRMGSSMLLFVIDMMRAWVMLRAGRHNECTEALTVALAHGREQGRTTYPNWHGRHVAALCEFALERSIEPDYVRHLIKTRKLLPPTEVSAPDLWPYPIKLYTLGRFSLLVDDKPVKFFGKSQKKPIELLKALIAFGGRDVLEGQITDLLWPEADGDAGHSAFTTTMQRLRKILGNEDAILIKEGKLTLNPQYCYVDTWAFERLIKRADEQWKGNKESEAILLFEKAVNIYKGSFLSKEKEQYVLTMQERLRSKFIRCLARIGDYLEKRGEWKKAVEYYQKGIEVDNLCEEFYQALMLCYQRLGLKAEAITAYNRCCNAMTALINTEPSLKTKEIYRQIMEKEKGLH